MPNLLTRRARIRWLEMQLSKAQQAWRKLVNLHAWAFACELDGVGEPSRTLRLQLAMARVRFYVQRIVRQIAQEG